ncbi:MAG: pilin [Rhodocyclaceae bacterium]
MRATPLLLALSLALVGCSGGSDTAAPAATAERNDRAEAAQSGPSVPMATPGANGAAGAPPPWLRDHLPQSAIAYLRVPAPWALIGSSGGRASDAMYTSEAYIAALRGQRDGLEREPTLAALGSAPLKLLLAQDSALEVAVLGTGGFASPGSNVLASVRLRTTDPATAAQLVGEALSAPGLTFDADGHASLDQVGVPLFLHFDAANARLMLLGGMYASADTLRTLRAEVANPNPGHAMRGLEQQIDAAGHGMVLWADIPALKPTLALGIQPQYEWLRPVLDQGRALALGFGSADGKGRMALRVDFEQAPWAAFTPTGPFDFRFDTIGQPRWVLTGALPSASQVASLIDLFAQTTLNDAGLNTQADADAASDGEDVAEGMAALDQALVKATGLDLAGWLAPFGREWVALRDEAGSYTAMRLGDAGALERVLAVVAEKTGKPVRTHEYRGQRLHHLILPAMPGMAEVLEEEAGTAGLDTPALNLLKLYSRIGQHLYWYEQDGWLISAGVPQPLMARIDADARRMPLTEWLRATQGAQRQQALLSASAELEDVAQTVYHMHLGLLQTLSDLVETPLDLFALPTAAQLGLPKRSGIGAEVVVDARQFALELNYEHSPAETLLAQNGLTAVAAGGILAAIAVPAYQDYTLRAEVSAAVAETRDVQAALADHYATHGNLPDDTAEAGVDLPRTLASGKGRISYHEGALFVHFSDASGALENTHLFLIPEVDTDGRLQWACADAYFGTPNEPLIDLPEDLPLTDVPWRYLPSHCR